MYNLLFLIKFSFSSLAAHADAEKDAELNEFLAEFSAQSPVPVREQIISDLCDSGEFVIVFVVVRIWYISLFYLFLVVFVIF